MTNLEFFDIVNNQEDLEGLGFDKVSFTVYSKTHKLKTRIPMETIKKIGTEDEVSTLLSILRGDREPTALIYMTRVIGYFSRTENWNRSKLGELKDRHKGNYSIEGE